MAFLYFQVTATRWGERPISLAEQPPALTVSIQCGAAMPCMCSANHIFIHWLFSASWIYGMHLKVNFLSLPKLLLFSCILFKSMEIDWQQTDQAIDNIDSWQAFQNRLPFYCPFLTAVKWGTQRHPHKAWQYGANLKLCQIGEFVDVNILNGFKRFRVNWWLTRHLEVGWLQETTFSGK